MQLTIPKRAQPIIDFAIHVVIGGVAFSLVFMVALALSLFVRLTGYLTPAPPWLTVSAEWVEKIIWGGDLAALGLFLLSELIALARKLWADRWRM